MQKATIITTHKATSLFSCHKAFKKTLYRMIVADEVGFRPTTNLLVGGCYSPN